MIFKKVLIILFILFSFLSCVSVNEPYIKESDTPDNIIEYRKPELQTEVLNVELILPEILQPVSIIIENVNETEVFNMGSIIHNPEIDLLSDTDNIQNESTEEELIRAHLSQNSNTSTNTSSNTSTTDNTDTIMQMETNSNVIEEKYYYTETPVEYISITEETVSDEDNQIIARIGDPIIINLEKEGWLFLGSENNEQLNGLKLISNEQSGGYSNFTFNALELGYYELKFLHQDNRNGTQATDTIFVTVLTDNEFENKLTGNVIETSNPEADFTYADSLMTAREYEYAITEYLKNYRESNSYLNDRIAEAYSNMGNNSLAMQYWIKNINTNAEYAEKAVIGIVNSSIATDDYSTLLRYVNRLPNIASTSIEEVLLHLTEYYKSRQDYQTAIDTYNLFMTRYPFSRMLDKMYFLMGTLYEENSSVRDFEKAIIFYEMIYEKFPESTKSRAARDRVDYINRHFFYIR